MSIPKVKVGIFIALLLFIASEAFYCQESEEAPQISEGFVLIEAGSFSMGTSDGLPAERPVHEITISRSFYMSKYEVTQKQWREVMGTNPVWFKKGDNLPVVLVSWYDAVEYCNKLSEREGLKLCYSGSTDNIQCDFSANGYRLPTEAEWEYAARGGKKSRGYKYAGGDSAESIGWYSGNSGGKMHEVGTKQPNELGLYDMSGNVSEWCWDWYDYYYYASSPSTDPRGPLDGSGRVFRSTSWQDNEIDLRVARRNYSSYPGEGIGFRPVRTSP